MSQEAETAERVRELLDRNLQEVFGESNDQRRRAALDELWAEDGVLYAPPGAVRGRAAIDKVAGELRASHPDFVYTPIGMPQVVQNGGRLAWGSGRPGEAPAYTGWDVIIVEDGKIAALYVFLDESSEEYLRSSCQ
ncbi:nuclear transport factor 2 family protein [Sphingomonas sp. BIUV-7]|uniref:Nuclear transport factor 2 family protein n=1 Tax=Sphingomonas natans TaxID=3063330 RepID=A0ABT8YBC0_9SPHN|nr:nuclear transport factor 2 family protein [Sphingomonas sp. BIUV-7]MDO6415614.1 nuclear transport factor 2 family protein [Sphingomonas sp. BIUV-7]